MKERKGKKQVKRTMAKMNSKMDNLRMDEKKTRAMVKSELRQAGPYMGAHVTQLAAAITMPKDYVSPRLGGTQGSDPTALANPWRREDITYPQATRPPEMSQNEFVSFVFRDALRHSLRPVALQASSLYQCGFLYSPAGFGEAYPILRDGGGSLPWVSGDQPHGSTLYTGRIGPADQHRGILMTKGDELIITLNPGPYAPGSVVFLIIKRLNAGVWNPRQEFSHPQAAGVQTFVFTADITGYYAFSFGYSQPGSIAADCTGDLKLNVGGSLPAPKSVWGQKALPFYYESYPFVDALRITGVSIMYTNTASPLNRQGQVVGLQVPRGSSWLQFTDFQTVSGDKKSVTRDIVEGAYGFLKPNSADDLNLKIYELPSDGTQANQSEDNVFLLYPESDFLCVIASCNVSAGQVGFLTFGTSLEYTTLSQWIEVRNGKLTDAELKNALEMISRVQQWHTNALHWDDIWEGIKDVGRTIWGGIKEVAPIAAAVAPLVL